MRAVVADVLKGAARVGSAEVERHEHPDVLKAVPNRGGGS